MTSFQDVSKGFLHFGRNDIKKDGQNDMKRTAGMAKLMLDDSQIILSMTGK